MVCPNCEALDQDQKEFYRRALLLLAEIRDTNERICRAIERVLGGPDDPRRQPHDLYRPRTMQSDK